MANALRDGLPADIGKADLGIVNPGGLRAELLYAGDTSSNPANTDGVVTYAEANAVLPFVNNIWTVDLTGAQLKTVLEQQWQPRDGTVPSRPFLPLGLSDNVRVTQDASKPVGSRITSVLINGSRSTRPSTTRSSRSRSSAPAVTTSARSRRARARTPVWSTATCGSSYLKDHARSRARLRPPAGRRERHAGAASTAGDSGVVHACRKLDLTSLGSPANTDVEATWQAPAAPPPIWAAFPVTGGSANVAFTAPAGTGGGEIRLAAQPSGTLVPIPVDHRRAHGVLGDGHGRGRWPTAPRCSVDVTVDARHRYVAGPVLDGDTVLRQGHARRTARPGSRSPVTPWSRAATR